MAVVAHGLMVIDLLGQDLWLVVGIRFQDLVIILDVLHGRVVAFLGLRLVLADHRIGEVSGLPVHMSAEDRGAFLVGAAGLVLVNVETDFLWRGMLRGVQLVSAFDQGAA